MIEGMTIHNPVDPNPTSREHITRIVASLTRQPFDINCNEVTAV